MRTLLAFTVAAALACAVSGCRRDAAPTGSSAARQASAPAVFVDRGSRCDEQAARVAAWRSRSGDPAHPPAWISHYSSKYDACYALIAQPFVVPAGTAPLVAELWDAFEATVLAESTADSRADMRRLFCRVDLSDDPVTSCAVAEFFIREHMAH